MNRILVTGATGFVGRHLVANLSQEPDVTVFGTTRRPSAPCGRVLLSEGDLTERGFVDQLIEQTRPAAIVHLAAQPSVAESWANPEATLLNNLRAQLNLLEATARYVPVARVVIAGSAEEYGMIAPEDLPAKETAPLRPDNPYAVSKVIQDFLGLQYFLGRNLDVIRVRPFNLFGPGQSDRFAIGSFARQIAEAEAGRREPILMVGNLSARRDYTDVRDAVRGYVALLRHGQGGAVYNLGGGGVRSIGDILEALRGLARCDLQVRIDPTKFRPVDAPIIAPDIQRISEETGWRPAISFAQTVQDILDDWRSRIAERPNNP